MHRRTRRGKGVNGMRTIIVGAGIAGCTAARLLAEKNQQVEIWEKRGVIAGNAYDCLNEQGIMIHRYGPHIFHTGIREVYDFLSRFTDWYPLEHRVPDGNNICLPYLAALIRLADEVDVAAARNPVLLYDIEALTDEIEIVENKKVLAVRSLQMSESAFTLIVSTPEEDILEEIRKMVGKMQRTLDCCRAAVNGRTPYVITQEKVLLEVQNAPTGE